MEVVNGEHPTIEVNREATIESDRHDMHQSIWNGSEYHRSSIFIRLSETFDPRWPEKLKMRVNGIERVYSSEDVFLGIRIKGICESSQSTHVTCHISILILKSDLKQYRGTATITYEA